jgi:hypothetical protein
VAAKVVGSEVVVVNRNSHVIVFISSTRLPRVSFPPSTVLKACKMQHENH